MAIDPVIVSEGLYFGQPITLACDGNCEKAWGIGQRPSVLLSMDEDDDAYLADDELDTAPIDPGTYEGDQAKPRRPVLEHNKWCCRACERCQWDNRGEPLTLRDFSKRLPNKENRNMTGLNDYTVYWTKSNKEGQFYISAIDLPTAVELAQWRIDLYNHTNGATFRIAEGLTRPIHGDVKDYAE